MADGTDDAEIKRLKGKVAKVAETTHKAASQLELELVRFKTGDLTIEFNVDLASETVWATQQDIADLFEVSRSTVAEHIQNIFKSKELDERTCCRKIRQVVSGGRGYEVLHYNLDLILSVGYRVSSPKATRFRQWANQTLRSYIVDGYAINEARLREDPGAANKLAAKLREIRASEKNVYASVRDFFKEASIDYDSKSSICHSFYAKISFILLLLKRLHLKLYLLELITENLIWDSGHFLVICRA